MLDNPEAMLCGDHTDRKKPCRTTCPVKVGSTPANCPPLEPGASCAVGHQVSRGHTDGHTHDLRGCNHKAPRVHVLGQAKPCWSKSHSTNCAFAGECPMPTHQTAQSRNVPHLPHTRLVIVGCEWAQPPCITTFYSCASAPQSLSVHADHAAHAVADAEHPRLSSLALEARLGPTSATLRLCGRRTSSRPPCARKSCWSLAPKLWRSAPLV